MHWMAIFEWLVQNNLLKATVAFWVTLILGGLVTLLLRPWKAFQKRRQLQERIADSLDTRTPGGLTELVHKLDMLLQQEEAQEDEDADGDDNGTDPHGGRVIPGHGPVIPDIHGGINGASHR
jgi:hypothetical protein